ncbi:hypothetical protein [Marilutibacter chinensis]|uniref:Secreted protein n=1 Tax=Marilutibacter chinensis TaxID=2912247 RepID=A0ABS9HY75_9GAMM|nr:hypothetical protein [Lysobacter chinensis]MCF7221277.1 hypothetical protein [Lysobacter chinensis]MCF7222982.1 hypothetical protein [Lysobacter chinensis]
MQRAVLALPLMLLAGVVQAQQAGDCSAMAVPRPMPIRPTIVAPVSGELTVPSHQLGAPTGVLAHAFNEAQSIDQVVFRLKLENCQSLAKAMPATEPAAIDAQAPAAYVPRTEFDNGPWRFDMNQNGKRMTAEEFDAWMKSRGVRVAKGAPAAAAPAPAVQADGPQTEGSGE